MADIPQDPKPEAPPSPSGGGVPDNPFDQPGGGGGGGGGASGGSSSGGSSGGGGGGGSPTDPLVSAGMQQYFRIWGQKPPGGYIENQVKKGWNIYEMEEFERSKSAFRRTRTYRDESQRLAAILRRELSA